MYIATINSQQETIVAEKVRFLNRSKSGYLVKCEKEKATHIKVLGRTYLLSGIMLREEDAGEIFVNKRELDKISSNVDYISMMSGVEIPVQGGDTNG